MLAPDSLNPRTPDFSLAGSTDTEAEVVAIGSLRPPEAVASKPDRVRLLLLVAVTICVVASLGTMTLTSRGYSPFSASPGEAAGEENLDQRLAKAATAALGDRRGTIIVMDPQTGRVRAVVNPQIAFEENLPPGSTIKPFTALAALKTGLIDETSQTLCHEKYAHEGFQTVCSHPRDLAPLNPTEAIAYSCNYYFGKVGERLNQAAFVSTLSEFGFGKSSGIGGSIDAQGKLPRNEWHSENAIGESVDLQATPIQVLDAYSALVNGGHLFTPRVAPARGYVPVLNANITIQGDHRSLIVKGMRGAVRYGTAETANLYSLPIYIFGKTGTATQINGFRSQGWFVGFASSAIAAGDNSTVERESAPENVKLAVLVFLTRAHGSEAAQVARPLFEEFARSASAQGNAGSESRGETRKTDEPPSARPSMSLAASAGEVRVHLVRENITRQMSLEDYVLGVVAAEGSTEREPEALKALAIASRTYALKNIGRHSADGYNFCTSTHCQRFRPVDSDSTASVSPAALQAVHATKGEVLLDAGNHVAESYFSASCGGATANLTSLWGAKAPPYLRGSADEYCTTDRHHNWTDVISTPQLLKAIQTDPRTNVGNQLDGIHVMRQDASGRAELIAIEGERRVLVKGWDFKIIVGRALGWNLLKSSRFQVSRAGSNFVFHGSGFGHGLGLCQEGAHTMALRGANYRQILTKYFPGTSVEARAAVVLSTKSVSVRQKSGGKPGVPSGAAPLGWKPSFQTSGLWDLSNCYDLKNLSAAAHHLTFGKLEVRKAGLPPLLDPQVPLSISRHDPAASEDSTRAFTDLIWHDYGSLKLSSVNPVEAKRLTLGSEGFRVNYPATVQQREIDSLLRFLQASRGSLVARIAGAGVSARFPALEVFVNETTGDFVGRTGQPAWVAAATKGNRIELQPLATLRRRRILETTLRHELVHVLIERIGHGRTPRWLAEGLAIHLAGEGRTVARYAGRTPMTTAEVEKQLTNAKSANEMRVAYAAAYSEVKRLISHEGETNVWRRVAK